MAEAEAPWQVHLTSIKPWPSCRHTHPIIDCALEIHELLGDQQPASIQVKTYQAALDVCDNPRPETVYQAKFSLYHTTAIAALDGAVGLDSFDDDARARSADLCAATAVEVADPYQSSYPVSWGAEVSIQTTQGQTFKVSRKDCKGDPEAKLDDDEMRVKAMGLLAYSGLDDNAASAVCDAILSLPSSPTKPELFQNFLEHATG